MLRIRILGLIIMLLSPWAAQAKEITHQVMVQPIVARDDNGKNPAKCHIDEKRIDQVYGNVGVDFYFLKKAYFDSTEVLKGKKDVDLIVKEAKDKGYLKGNGQIINLFFVDAINGQPAPRGLGQQPGWLVFIAMKKEAPEGQDAFVVAHECGHNLGLGHAVDDPKVPNDIPNLMGDGPFVERVGPKGLTDHQTKIIYKSPLVKPLVECLNGEVARTAIVDETVEPYFTQLQRREIKALLGRTLPRDWTLVQCREEVKLKFQGAVLDFSKEEAQALKRLTDLADGLLKKDFPLFARFPWRFIKVADHHCAGMAYTRTDCIVLSQKRAERLCGAEKTKDVKGAAILVHEKMHVLQRFFPDRFDPLYEQHWGFVKAKVAPNDWLIKHQITNPDAPFVNWITLCKGKDNIQRMVWMRTLVMGDREVPRLGLDFTAAAVFLKKHDEGYGVICDPEGKPTYQTIDQFPEYAQRFCQASQRGLDHPHEIAAYAFADLFVTKYVHNKPLSNQRFWTTFIEWARRHLD